ncbi:hypothetical protein ACLI1A_06075 [Flavobacterium sp. RHBU_3]|uniref:hypothetical protein n=1 Tax=Flavobacterium sp. RHBU_3 TaxID=3391184 RepID=UPI00398558AE
MLQRLHKTIITYPVYAIVAVCLLVRLIIAFIYRDVTLFPDSGDYIALADILSHGRLNGYTGERTPGYPLLISLLGNSQPLVVAIQLLSGIVTALYTYKTLQLIGFTKATATYTAIILNCLLHLVFNEFCILTESLTLLMLTLAFYHFLKLFLNGSTNVWQIVLITFFTAYLTFIKPFYAFIPFVFYGMYVLKNFSFRNVINPIVLPVLASLTIFFGWSYVNKVNTGYFVSTTYYGLNLAQNCVYFAENVPDEYKEIGLIYAKHRDIALKENKDVAMSIWFAYEDLKQYTGLKPAALNDLLGKYAKAAISQNKDAYAKQVFTSWIKFWGTDMFWNYGDFYCSWGRKPLLVLWYCTKWLVIALKAIFVLFTPYYFFQYLKTRKIDKQLLIYALVFAASVLQAIITFGTNSRYSFPFETLIFTSLLLTIGRFTGNKLLNQPKP